MSETTISQANQIRDRIAALHPELRRARVWVAEDGHARVYTGFRDEHVRVDVDGTVSRSQAKMTWGHLIADVLEG